jgi:hypothetical protein
MRWTNSPALNGSARLVRQGLLDRLSKPGFTSIDVLVAHFAPNLCEARSEYGYM